MSKIVLAAMLPMIATALIGPKRSPDENADADEPGLSKSSQAIRRAGDAGQAILSSVISR